MRKVFLVLVAILITTLSFAFSGKVSMESKKADSCAIQKSAFKYLTFFFKMSLT